MTGRFGLTGLNEALRVKYDSVEYMIWTSWDAYSGMSYCGTLCESNAETHLIDAVLCLGETIHCGESTEVMRGRVCVLQIPTTSSLCPISSKSLDCIRQIIVLSYKVKNASLRAQ